MTSLPGRSAECQVLRDTLAASGSGRGQVKVLLGEAGIGKTALLGCLRDAADNHLVLSATGIESEMELAFAGLQQVCAPILDLRHELPPPQRDAIEGAFGLGEALAVPDRFLVGLAVLGLFAAASRDQPVLVLVDDLQWFDDVSAQTLLFVARRLLAEPVCLVVALRTPVDGIAGLPAMVISGIDTKNARDLLEAAYPGRIDSAVRDRIVAEARGNPLALLAIPKDLSAAELAGGYHRTDHRPATADIEDHYRVMLQTLPEPARQTLLLASAEPLGDPALLRSAMEQLGLPPDAVLPAEEAGLVSIGTRVQFHHPLARSVVYRSAGLFDRRAAHGALARVTDATADPDRRAWHRALAAHGVDAEVAEELETSARRAMKRGGTAAAAAFLTRSVELTPDLTLRGTRALAAAEAHREVASFESAHTLLATAELCPLTALQRARLTQLRTRLAFISARAGGDAAALVAAVDAFNSVAAQLCPLDIGMATEAYLEAMTAAMYVGRHAGRRAAEIAGEARAAFAGVEATAPIEEVAHALADRLALGAAAAMPAMRAALGALKRAVEKPGERDWFWLGFPLVHESLIHESWDDGWHQLSTGAARLAGERGALALVPATLLSRAGAHMETGELETAKSFVAEANEISIATGYSPLKYHKLIVSAWAGDPVEAKRLIASALADSATRGEGRIAGLAHYAAAVLNNGAAQYRDALDAALSAFEYEDLGFFCELLLELIEAAARSGEPHCASDALDILEARTLAAGTPRALGSLARSRALLTDGVDAEALYVEAIEHFSRSDQAVHLARARLLYGEWLRRRRKSGQAREHLRSAHAALSQMGSAGFAERARRELHAAGAKAAQRSTRRGESLSPQEHQIAQLAARGLTNQEIAEQLFISAHTVEYHLRKIFAKLDIRSRRDLRELFH